MPISPVVPSGPDGAFSHAVFLEQITVTSGVYRMERISTADDLVIGDAYRFPAIAGQVQSELQPRGTLANIRLMPHLDIGTATLGATRTHHIILMSRTGHTVSGDVFATRGQRTFTALQEPVDPGSEYILIAMTPEREN